MEQDKQPAIDPFVVDTIADNKVVRNFVFFGSAAAAVATAAVSIWDEFYHEIKKIGPLEGNYNDRKTKISEAYAEGLANTKTPQQVRSAVHEANALYTAELQKKLPKIGISNDYFKGTIDRAKNLGMYNLGGIAMKTGASLAITLGGYYLINQNVRMKASNRHQDAQLQKLGNRIDEQVLRHAENYEHVERVR